MKMIWLHLTSTTIPVVNVRWRFNEGTMVNYQIVRLLYMPQTTAILFDYWGRLMSRVVRLALIMSFCPPILSLLDLSWGRAAFSMEGMSRRGRRRCSCGPVLTCVGSWVAGHPLPCPPLLSLPLWGRLIHPNAPASPLASIWTYGDRVRGWGRMVRRKCSLQHRVLARHWPLPIPTHCHPTRRGRRAHMWTTAHINL